MLSGHRRVLGGHSYCVSGIPFLFVICRIFKGPLERQPEGELDPPVPVAPHKEVNDRVESAVHTGQHKADLGGIEEFVAQEVKEDEDAERHGKNEEEEHGEHDDGEEPSCSEVLGAALDSEEEGQAEEHHEGCADQEIQDANGNEQHPAAAGGADGAQNIASRVQ